MDNADQQNISSKLSADVEPFVPRQYQVPVLMGQNSYSTPFYSHQPLQDIPSYITNCYPFVQEEYCGYEYSPRAQWQNNYFPNVAIQPPQQYAGIQVPFSPVYQPCQYSQPYHNYVAKPKPAPQPRSRQQAFLSESGHRRKNWTTPQVHEVSSLQLSLTNMTITSPVGQEVKPERNQRPTRSDSTRFTKSVKTKNSNNNSLKDRTKDTISHDAKKTNTSSEGAVHVQQPAAKSRPSQSHSGTRYHNRTLGDFLLTVKTPKKGRVSVSQPKNDVNNCARKSASKSSTKKHLQGTLPNGFEIRNSDWPTAGGTKPVQITEQERNCLLGTSIVLTKPKSFADIIKSSPSKSTNLSQTKNDADDWSLENVQMTRVPELSYFSADNSKSFTCFDSVKNSDNYDKVLHERRQYCSHSVISDKQSKVFANQALPFLEQSDSIYDDINKVNNYSIETDMQVPCESHSSIVTKEKESLSTMPFPRSHWKLTRKSNTSFICPKKELNKPSESSGKSNFISTNTSGKNSVNKYNTGRGSCSKDASGSNFERDVGTLQKFRKFENNTRHSSLQDCSKKECRSLNCNETSDLPLNNAQCCNKIVCKNHKVSQNLCTAAASCSESSTLKPSEDGTNDLPDEVVTKNVQRDSSKKKRKKKSPGEKSQLRKCQLAALQGKMILVSQDMYSKLMNSNTTGVAETKQSTSYVSNDTEDYPSLGSMSISKVISATKIGSSEKCCVPDDDPEWSDIDSDYESSTGTFGVGNLNESTNTLPLGSTNYCRETSKPKSPSGLSYSAALRGESDQHIQVSSVNCIEQENQVNGNQAHHVKRTKKKKVLSKSTCITDPGSIDKQKKPKLVKPKPNQPIQLDLSQMLIASQSMKVKKQKALPTFTGKSLGKDSKLGKSFSIVANILDSTAPARRRGKEREIPAKKQPSALKKIILKEREERKQQRLREDEKRKRLLSGSSLSDNDGSTSQDSAWETQGSASSATPSIIDGDEGHDNNFLPALAKSLIHSRRFREYCNHMLKSEIDNAVTQLLQDLIRFHNRLYHKDPLKAKARRRIVLGLREVTKHLKLRKLKCLILAPNLDRIKSKGGLDDAIDAILSLAREQNIPCVFALGRKPLGKVCFKQVPVSCVGIFNYSGSEKNFQRLMDLVNEAQLEYLKVLQNIEKDLEPDSPSVSGHSSAVTPRCSGVPDSLHPFAALSLASSPRTGSANANE